MSSNNPSLFEQQLAQALTTTQQVNELPDDFLIQNANELLTRLSTMCSSHLNPDKSTVLSIQQICRSLRLIATRDSFRAQFNQLGIIDQLVQSLIASIDHLERIKNTSGDGDDDDVVEREEEHLESIIYHLWSVMMNSVTQQESTVLSLISSNNNNTNNNKNSNDSGERLWNDATTRTIDLLFDYRRTIKVVCMTLFNAMSCCSQMKQVVFNNQNLLLLLLEAYMEEQSTDDASEWILLIWSHLLTHVSDLDDYTDTVVSLVAQLLRKKKMRSTLHLAEMLHIYTKDRTIQREDLDRQISDEDSVTLKVISNMAILIAKCIFYRVMESVHQLSCPFQLDTQRVHYLKFAEFETLFLCLEILANTTSMDHDLIQTHLMSHQIIHFVLDVFSKAPPPDPKAPGHTTASTQEASMDVQAYLEDTGESVSINRDILNQTGIPVLYETEDEHGTLIDQSMFLGYRCHLLRLVGNMCFDRRENQDLVRTLEGIPLVLNHCYSDDQNPYLREWGVFCIRNLTENNLENQELISKFQTLQVDPRTQDMLNEMGVQAELDPNDDGLSAKLTIKRKSGDE